MRRYSFSLSPTYVARRARDESDRLDQADSVVPVCTLLLAVLLATTIYALVWFG